MEAIDIVEVIHEAERAEKAERYIRVLEERLRKAMALLGEEATCRSCGAPIYWCNTKAGRRIPMNPDGTTHFANCPQSKQWRKGQKGGA